MEMTPSCCTDKQPVRGRTLLDLLLTDREGLVEAVVAGGQMGQSDHEMIEFSLY